MTEWLSQFLLDKHDLSLMVGAVSALLMMLPLLIWSIQKYRRAQSTLSNNQQAYAAQLAEADVNQDELSQELEQLKQQFQGSQQQLIHAQTRLEQLAVQSAQIKQQSEKIEQLQANLSQEKSTLAALRAQSGSEQQAAKEKIQWMEAAQNQLKNQFTALANEILEEKTQVFRSKSQESVQQILQPLQQKLGDFQQLISHAHEQDVKDRSALKQQIEMLNQQSQSIGKEAHELSQALTGQAKLRGLWGEMLLEKALQLSGLESGREYQTEVSFTLRDGSRFRPDVLVKLPDGKTLIIDAKVALNDYKRFVNAEDESEKKQALKAHVQALRQHFKQLSEKKYDQIPGLETLDFVLMFVPVETAFIEATHQDHSLYDDAFRKHVIIVTASTLLASLRTVANLWRYEKQQQNAQKIAEHGAKLYNKFVNFVEDLNKIGKSLDQAQGHYDAALNKLSSGRGNLLRQVDQFREMGVQPRKNISLGDEAADALTDEDDTASNSGSSS